MLEVVGVGCSRMLAERSDGRGSYVVYLLSFFQGDGTNLTTLLLHVFGETTSQLPNAHNHRDETCYPQASPNPRASSATRPKSGLGISVERLGEGFVLAGHGDLVDDFVTLVTLGTIETLNPLGIGASSGLRARSPSG